jgi:hypothetical protein
MNVVISILYPAFPDHLYIGRGLPSPVTPLATGICGIPATIDISARSVFDSVLLDEMPNAFASGIGI